MAAHLPWARWEAFVQRSGVTLDRPRGHRHPRFPDIVYPLDYGYVNGTDDGQGEGVDVFVGTAPALGLVGALLTRDFRRGDREVKLLLGTRPEEVYLAHGFLNFDRTLLDATLALRYRDGRTVGPGGGVTGGRSTGAGRRASRCGEGRRARGTRLDSGCFAPTRDGDDGDAGA